MNKYIYIQTHIRMCWAHVHIHIYTHTNLCTNIHTHTYIHTQLIIQYTLYTDHISISYWKNYNHKFLFETPSDFWKTPIPLPFFFLINWIILGHCFSFTPSLEMHLTHLWTFLMTLFEVWRCYPRPPHGNLYM